MFKKIFFLVSIMATLAVATSFTILPHHKAGANLVIHFQNYVGEQLLQLDTVNYKNDAGQPYTISKFKYYIGNIHLKKADGSEFISHEYFLVDEDNEASKEITLKNIPDAHYTSIEFLLGVDSLHNCSGAQSGALDPMNGMFWAWNTGYIFLKIEGHAPASKSPGHIFEFHVGGYKSPANCIRSIKLNFKSGLQVTHEKSSSILLKADASKIFKSPHPIDFSKISSVTDFHNATAVADNYAGMFSILAIQ